MSHAREFLNAVCTDILHLHSAKLITYKGNYDTFEKTAAERARNAQKAAEAQSAKRAHIQARTGPAKGCCMFSYGAVAAHVMWVYIACLQQCHALSCRKLWLSRLVLFRHGEEAVMDTTDRSVA